MPEEVPVRDAEGKGDDIRIRYNCADDAERPEVRMAIFDCISSASRDRDQRMGKERRHPFIQDSGIIFTSPG